MDKLGFYRISCGDCDSLYIGQAGRKLGKPFQEHKNEDGSLGNGQYLM